MIDIIILIVFIIALGVLSFIKIHDEARTILSLLIASGLFFYCALNIGNANASKIFMILTFITCFYVPIAIMIKYIEKIRSRR